MQTLYVLSSLRKATVRGFTGVFDAGSIMLLIKCLTLFLQEGSLFFVYSSLSLTRTFCTTWLRLEKESVF